MHPASQCACANGSVLIFGVEGRTSWIRGGIAVSDIIVDLYKAILHIKYRVAHIRMSLHMCACRCTCMSTRPTIRATMCTTSYIHFKHALSLHILRSSGMQDQCVVLHTTFQPNPQLGRYQAPTTTPRPPAGTWRTTHHLSSWVQQQLWLQQLWLPCLHMQPWLQQPHSAAVA